MSARPETLALLDEWLSSDRIRKVAPRGQVFQRWDA